MNPRWGSFLTIPGRKRPREGGNGTPSKAKMRIAVGIRTVIMLWSILPGIFPRVRGYAFSHPALNSLSLQEMAGERAGQGRGQRSWQLSSCRVAYAMTVRCAARPVMSPS